MHNAANDSRSSYPNNATIPVNDSASSHHQRRDSLDYRQDAFSPVRKQQAMPDYDRESKSALNSSGRYAAPIVPKKLDFYGSTKQQQDFEYEKIVRQATNLQYKAAQDSSWSGVSSSGYYEPISKAQDVYTPERRPYNVDSDFSSTRKTTGGAASNYV